MRYPIGEAVHEQVPSQLLKIDMLSIWMEEEKFDGVLVAESDTQRIEVLVTAGKGRYAINTHRGGRMFGKEAIEALLIDADLGNLKLSLYRFKPEVTRPLLAASFIKPQISQMSSEIIMIVKLMENCLNPDLISHILLETPEGEGHILFDTGVLVGSYTDRQPALDNEFKDFYSLYHDIGGKVSMTQIRLDEFAKMELPELEFASNRSETDNLAKLLVTFLNFTRTAYGNNGLPPDQTTGLFKRVAENFTDSPVMVIENEFRITSTSLQKEKMIAGFVDLLKKFHAELAQMWGPKIASSRYHKIYDNFLRETKGDERAKEVLESVAPERIGL